MVQKHFRNHWEAASNAEEDNEELEERVLVPLVRQCCVCHAVEIEGKTYPPNRYYDEISILPTGEREHCIHLPGSSKVVVTSGYTHGIGSRQCFAKFYSPAFETYKKLPKERCE